MTRERDFHADLKPKTAGSANPMKNKPDESLLKTAKQQVWFLLRCLFSKKFRKYQGYPLMRRILRENSDKVLQEFIESEKMLEILWKYSKREPVTAKERRFALSQMKDLIRIVPAFAIFLLPGGALLLPLIARAIPWRMLPSAFSEKPKN